MSTTTCESESESLSRVQLFKTPWTVALQAPPSMGFSRQEYWSGLPFPSPGDLPDPGLEPRSPSLQADPCEEGIIIIIFNNKYFLNFHIQRRRTSNSPLCLSDRCPTYISSKQTPFLLPSTSSLQHQTGSHQLYSMSTVKGITIHCVVLFKSLPISLILNQIH